MNYGALQTFAGLTTAAAGIALGMSLLIVAVYWKVFCAARNSRRLLPAHVMGIGVSYAMLAIVAVARLGQPPPIRTMGFTEWWIYPFITTAFIIGDVALLFILMFIHKRGSRYPKPNKDDTEHGIA